MKVVLVCYNDWAHHGTALSIALKGVGVDAQMWAQKLHPYKYPYKPKLWVGRQAELHAEAESADVIIFMHSQLYVFPFDIGKKLVVVYHTGSPYRQGHIALNARFNPMVDITLNAPDTWERGAVNEKWLLVPIDLAAIKPVYERRFPDKLVFAHYPSGEKGSEAVRKAFAKPNPRAVFDLSKGRASWEQNLLRMAACDVYVETQKTHQKGIETSCYGLSAIEAGALGKIVVTRFLHKEIFEKEFGPCAIQCSNDPAKLREAIDRIAVLPQDEVDELKKASRHWVETSHSYKAVGTRLKLILEGRK